MNDEPIIESPNDEAHLQPWWTPDMANRTIRDEDLTPEMEAYLQQWYAARGISLDEIREAEAQIERGEFSRDLRLD